MSANRVRRCVDEDLFLALCNNRASTEENWRVSVFRGRSQAVGTGARLDQCRIDLQFNAFVFQSKIPEEDNSGAGYTFLLPALKRVEEEPVSLTAGYTVLGKGDLWKGGGKGELVGNRKDEDLKGIARKVMY